ncbi:MAG: HTTM domain-containing protein [Myxococcales bacterium]|nr:HTTM domain-containing protein [Myxococcales bacterium]
MNALLSRTLGALTAFFAAPVSGTSAALYRVALGGCCFWYAFTLALNVERYFSETGAFPWAFAPRDARWGAFALAPQDEAWALTIFVVVMGLSVVLALGVLPRLVCAVLYYLSLSIHYRNPTISSAADQLLHVLLFLSIFLPLGYRLSVDAVVRRRLGRATPTGSIWSQRLVQMQVAVVYGMTAVTKAGEEVWQSGDALRGFLAMPSYSTWPMWHDPWPFMKPLTWGTLAFELAFAALIWFRPLRPWLLGAGVAFHTGIGTLMQIPLLSGMMIMTYLLFIPDDVAERAVARAGAWLRRRRRG